MKKKVILAVLSLSLGAQAQMREVVLNVSPVLSKYTVLKTQADGSVMIENPRVNTFSNLVSLVTFESAEGICATIQKKQVVTAEQEEIPEDVENYGPLSIVNKEGFLVGRKHTSYYLSYLICK